MDSKYMEIKVLFPGVGEGPTGIIIELVETKHHNVCLLSFDTVGNYFVEVSRDISPENYAQHLWDEWVSQWLKVKGFDDTIYYNASEISDDLMAELAAKRESITAELAKILGHDVVLETDIR